MKLHSMLYIRYIWKMVWRFPKKLRIIPSYDPAIPLLGMYPEEMRTERDTCAPVFTAALLQQLDHGSNLDVHRQMNG